MIEESNLNEQTLNDKDIDEDIEEEKQPNITTKKKGKHF